MIYSLLLTNGNPDMFSEAEKIQLKTGELLTHPCYTPFESAYCESVARKYQIKFRIIKSEDATGKTMFMFLFYPDTLNKAFQVGAHFSPFIDSIKKEDLIPELEMALIIKWEKEFR